MFKMGVWNSIVNQTAACTFIAFVTKKGLKNGKGEGCINS